MRSWQRCLINEPPIKGNLSQSSHTLRLPVAKPLLPEASRIVKCLVFRSTEVMLLCSTGKRFFGHLKLVFGVIWGGCTSRHASRLHVTLFCSPPCSRFFLRPRGRRRIFSMWRTSYFKSKRTPYKNQSLLWKGMGIPCSEMLTYLRKTDSNGYPDFFYGRYYMTTAMYKI